MVSRIFFSTLCLLQEVNLDTGYVCGSMRADNVPQAKTPVVTFWEGDIIDNVNHSFITSSGVLTRRLMCAIGLDLMGSCRCGGKCTALVAGMIPNVYACEAQL